MAENAATGSDAIATIKRSKLSWRYVKAALGLREFNGTPEEIRDEMEALHSDLIAHDVVMIDEWVGIEDDFSEYELVPIEEWEYAGYYDYLRYDPNGGKDGPSNEWYKDETEISEIIPTLDGTQFLGWAKSAEATEPEYQPGDRFAANANTTLFAVWETNNPVYRVVSGADETYILDSGKDYVFTVKRNVNDGHCFEHFTGVDLDGKTLTIGMDYTAVKGSTVVTIKSAVLNRLSVGPHTITVSFDDGEVEISLTVKEVSTPAPEPFGPYLVPDTGTK
ncbi:MAG: InlB B-repeat-containing protein, partial [Erysipelotrichaceae bacterium]|nr:InlB B-repeat-containing protein [Erysipelotrichaceae bacterium]